MVETMVLVNTILEFVFLGNEVWRFLAFILCLIVVYPISKLIQYISKNYLVKWSEKTSFKFDDILISSLNPPISMFVFAGFFYLGSSFINQGEYSEVFTKIFNFLMIIPFVYFMIKFSTEIVGFYLKGESKKGKVNEAAIDLLMQVLRISLFFIGIFQQF